MACVSAVDQDVARIFVAAHMRALAYPHRWHLHNDKASGPTDRSSGSTSLCASFLQPTAKQSPHVTRLIGMLQCVYLTQGCTKGNLLDVCQR